MVPLSPRFDPTAEATKHRVWHSRPQPPCRTKAAPRCADVVFFAQGCPPTSEALDLHLQSVGHQSGLNRRQSGLNWCPSGGTCVARGKKKFGYQGTLLKVAPEGNKTSPPHRCTVSTRGVTFVPACTLGLTSSRAAGGRTAIRTTAKDEHCKPMNSISWRTGNLRQSYAICGADRCWPSGWLAGCQEKFGMIPPHGQG